MLEDRSYRIVRHLLQETGYTSVDTFTHLLSVSKRTVYNDIDQINALLESQGLETLRHVRAHGYMIRAEQRDAVEAWLQSSVSVQSMDSAYRIHLIFCLLLASNERVDIERLQEVTWVSRNTLFTDLKLVRARMLRYDLSLEYQNKTGYTIEGDTIKKRSLFLYHYLPLQDALPAEMLENVLMPRWEDIKRYYERLLTIEQLLRTEYVEGTLSGLASLMVVEKLYNLEEIMHVDTLEDITLTQEYSLMCTYFPEFSEANRIYYAIHLLGARTQIRVQNPNVGKYAEYAIAMIQRFELLSAIEFTQVSLLISNLANHLSISFFRYRFGLHQSNPLLEQIKTQYPEIFDIANQACDILREGLHVPVSESEVAYIALHFNSFIRRNNYEQHEHTIAIVCPQGVSTSAMLKREIEALIPEIKITELLSLKQFYAGEFSDEPDVLLSTVALDTRQSYIQIHPVLTEMDKELLIRRLAPKDGSNQSVSADRILKIIEPYLDDQHYQIVKQEIQMVFQGANRTREPEIQGYIFEDVFTPTMISVSTDALSWRDALYYSAKPLIDTLKISYKYPEAILYSIDKFGPYMILQNGYMLAHASYEDGVHDVGLSLLVLEHPITIEDKHADKIFILAPIDQTNHLGIVSELMTLFSSDSLHKSLNASMTPEAIHVEILRALSKV